MLKMKCNVANTESNVACSFLLRGAGRAPQFGCTEEPCVCSLSTCEVTSVCDQPRGVLRMTNIANLGVQFAFLLCFIVASGNVCCEKLAALIKFNQLKRSKLQN